MSVQIGRGRAASLTGWHPAVFDEVWEIEYGKDKVPLNGKYDLEDVLNIKYRIGPDYKFHEYKYVNKYSKNKNLSAKNIQVIRDIYQARMHCPNSFCVLAADSAVSIMVERANKLRSPSFSLACREIMASIWDSINYKNVSKANWFNKTSKDGKIKSSASRYDQARFMIIGNGFDDPLFSKSIEYQINKNSEILRDCYSSLSSRAHFRSKTIKIYKSDEDNEISKSCNDICSFLYAKSMSSFFISEKFIELNKVVLLSKINEYVKSCVPDADLRGHFDKIDEKFDVSILPNEGSGGKIRLSGILYTKYSNGKSCSRYYYDMKFSYFKGDPLNMSFASAIFHAGAFDYREIYFPLSSVSDELSFGLR